MKTTLARIIGNVACFLSKTRNRHFTRIAWWSDGETMYQALDVTPAWRVLVHVEHWVWGVRDLVAEPSDIPF